MNDHRENARARVVCTSYVPPDARADLRGAIVFQPNRDNGVLLSRAETLVALGDADALITQGELAVDYELLARAPRLRIVANVSRGYDNLDLAALTARAIWATNVPAAFAPPTAEVALGLILMVMRRLGEADRYVQAGQWDRFDPGRWDGYSLVGKTLGIVGFGQIGREVAARAQAFGLRIVIHARNAILDTSFPLLPLDDLLASSDIVSLHIPATRETFHLMNTERFSRMRAGAVFINTARGSVVDEAALVHALQSGHLRGAGLDVAAHEPHVHPALLGLPNVVVTPHLGGGAIESRRAARQHAMRNVAAVLAGERPITPLNAIPSDRSITR